MLQIKGRATHKSSTSRPWQVCVYQAVADSKSREKGKSFFKILHSCARELVCTAISLSSWYVRIWMQTPVCVSVYTVFVRAIPGKCGIGLRSGYCGAKAAVLGWMDALRAEEAALGTGSFTVLHEFAHALLLLFTSVPSPCLPLHLRSNYLLKYDDRSKNPECMPGLSEDTNLKQCPHGRRQQIWSHGSQRLHRLACRILVCVCVRARLYWYVRRRCMRSSTSIPCDGVWYAYVSGGITRALLVFRFVLLCSCERMLAAAYAELEESWIARPQGLCISNPLLSLTL